MLPCSYFLVTFTLPQELRPLAFANQKKVYGLLMRTAAAALQKLSLDPRYLGGRPGFVAVLHTWTRDLRYHPHVHMLVTAGGLSLDGTEWLPASYADYLVPEPALAIIFRAKLCAALKKAGLLNQVPRQVWKKDWVVDCKPVGSGKQALNYLARYIFRVAISNSRLERFENGEVTFRYRDNRSQQLLRVTLPVQKFIHRFLLHTLPRGCAKVRYYGIWSPTCRAQLEQARSLLGLAATPAAPTPTAPTPTAIAALPNSPPTQPAAPVPTPARCPHCRLGQLFEIRVLPRQRKPP